MKILFWIYAATCLLIGWIIALFVYPLRSIIFVVKGTWSDVDDYLEEKMKSE